MNKIEIKLAEECTYCVSKIKELEGIFKDFEEGVLPKDIKLTLEFNSDWIGKPYWHLNKVALTERKLEE